MNGRIPKKIYRYQRFSALSLDALCQDKLFFSQPANFNDPLDCSPVVQQDSDISSLRNILEALIVLRVEKDMLESLKAAKVVGNGAAKHASKHAKQAAKAQLGNIAYHATNPEYDCSVAIAECRLLTSAIQNELLRQHDRGICCFSASYNNPLLWSHYGDQHYGYCVGYSLNRNPVPSIHKVLYGGQRFVKTSLIAAAILNNDAGAQKELDENILLRKASSWQYEREWRVFDHTGLQDSPLLLEEIVFGLRCPDTVVHAITSALKRRKINFFKIHNIPGSFTLKRIAADLGELSAFFPVTAISGLEMFGAVDDGK